MVRRPTAGWREHVAAELFPEEMLDRTDEVLTAFEADVAALVEQRWEPATDTEIFEVIERTVRALNAVNDRMTVRPMRPTSGSGSAPTSRARSTRPASTWTRSPAATG